MLTHGPTDPDNGPIVLLAAIVLQALKDAAHGDDAARDWLHGGGCDQLLTACGLELSARAFMAPRSSKAPARV